MRRWRRKPDSASKEGALTQKYAMAELSFASKVSFALKQGVVGRAQLGVQVGWLVKRPSTKPIW